jgi:hypothetical protein
MLNVGTVLGLAEGYAAERTTEVATDAVGELLYAQAGIVDGLLGARDGKLGKPVEAPCAASRQIVGRVEVVDLGGQARPEGRRVEARNDADGRLTAENAGPQAGCSTANRR